MERVICYTSQEGLEVIKTIGLFTWIDYLPQCLSDLFVDNYEASLEAVKYVPKLYFYLDKQFQIDKKMIANTKIGFKRHNKMNWLIKSAIPLKIKDKYQNVKYCSI